MSEHVEVEEEFNVGDTIDISFVLTESVPGGGKVIVTFMHQDQPEQHIVLSQDLPITERHVHLTYGVSAIETSGVYTLDSVKVRQDEGFALEREQEITETVPRGMRIRLNPYKRPEKEVTGFVLKKT